ncbi:hypothetical protein [Lederbergia lenta]|nr:hypothetical protein [Lederbergia lenta]MCM3113229.1 hypothetical protein [Lederbergia lenta]MEC2325982.1 hypothetical protein [Lederbergia lenta]
MSYTVKPPPLMSLAEGKNSTMAEPYVGAWELAFISPDIFIGQGVYRLLGIYSGSSGKVAAEHFHKFHILNEEGKVVDDETIALYCIKVYVTFYKLMISNKDIEYSLLISEKDNVELRDNLLDIKESVDEGYIQDHGKRHKLFKDMDEMLVYLEMVEGLETKMHEYAKQIRKCEADIQDETKMNKDVLDALLTATSQFKKNARQKGILLMQNQHRLRMVRTLLQDDLANKYLDPDQKEKAKRMIKKIGDEIEYQQIVYSTHDMVLFTPKGYIKKLQQIPDDYIRLEAEQFVGKKWMVTKKPSLLKKFKREKEE